MKSEQKSISVVYYVTKEAFIPYEDLEKLLIFAYGLNGELFYKKRISFEEAEEIIQRYFSDGSYIPGEWLLETAIKAGINHPGYAPMDITI
uniref:hypothetical protein n=1 Tax=Lachnoclostridium phocaeense TaxID=1871021 RepID=UPI0026DB2D9A|nr:hypothetical protein [Lachnoclostridium phocaeense]